MKAIAKVKDILLDINGNGIVSLIVSNYRQIQELKQLDGEKNYAVEIKEVKTKRSLEQNRLLWKLLGEIDKVINGGRSDDVMNIYTLALEKANAKYEYIGALPQAEEMLKQNFRAIKFIKKIDLNGVEGNMYKCFIGSSKMDTKEMTLLIDTVMDMAEQVGIDTDWYKEQFR